MPRGSENFYITIELAIGGFDTYVANLIYDLAGITAAFLINEPRKIPFASPVSV